MLNRSFGAAPDNDRFTDASVIVGRVVSVAGSTVGATIDPGEFRWGDNQGGHSIWYRWVAPDAGVCTLSGSGPGAGLLFTVSVGTSPRLADLSLVADNAFAGSGILVRFRVEAGREYRIRVDGYWGEEGDITMKLVLGPFNDEFSDATSIYGDQYAIISSTLNASREEGESRHGGVSTGHSVWWTWTAPASAQVHFQVRSPNLEPALSAYIGTALTNLTLIAEGTNAVNGELTVSFEANAGLTYAIALDGRHEEGANYSLSMKMDLLRIGSPLPGEVIGLPADIRLSVQIPASITGVTQVEYYDNQKLITIVTNAPFGFLWENVSPGSHPIVARSVSADARTNQSLPAAVFVYTNGVPIPKLASWVSSTYVIDALGNLHVFGLNGLGFYGLGTLQDYSTCLDPFECDEVKTDKLWYPEIARFPNGVTGWLAVSGSAYLEIAGQDWQSIGGWALGNDKMLYRYGVLPFAPSPPATHWTHLNRGSMVDNLGRLYYEGRLRDPQSSIPFKDIVDGILMTTNGVAYTFDGVTYSALPFPSGVTNWKSLSCSSHCLGIGGDGQLYVWGYNYSGQLGLGDNADRSNPTRLPPPLGVTNWVVAVAGGHHSLAIGDNGQLYAWGRNWESQLGIGYVPNNTTNRPGRVQLPAGVNRWVAAHADFTHSLAIADDCHLYSWGANGDGQLGTGPGPSAPFPARVPGLGSLCGIPTITASQSRRLPDGSFLLEFPTKLNQLYSIQYSADSVHWTTAFPAVVGTGELIQWTDSGPPRTDSHPSSQPARAYRIVTGL